MTRTIAIDASRAGVGAKTGTEWYSYELIRAMNALDDRPSLTLYHRSVPDLSLHGPNVRHRLIDQRRLWTHIGLASAMRRDRPDALFVPSHVIPTIHPPASVVTIHDLGYLAEPDAHPAASRRMLDLTTRWNTRAARAIIAISGQTSDDLVTHYNVDPARIHVIHSGLDHDRFRPLEPDAIRPTLARHNIDRPYVFFLSTVQPRKNVVRLVEAFEQIDCDMLLVIAGRSGWLSEPIEERIAASPASNCIRRLGHVADHDIPALYNGAEVFVLPSLYEGFGMGILEAMASGCPIVTSDRSSLPEVAGGAAILIDPTDVEQIRQGILRAISEPERDRLIEAGLVRARQFTWARTAAETMQVIQRAIDER